MRKLYAVALTALVSACLLGSCNKPAGEGEAAPPAAGASASSGQATASIPPAATPEDAAAPSGSASKGAQDAGTKSMAVQPVDLSGKWLALFGRTAGGSTIEDAYKTGEMLEFKGSSEMVWTQPAKDKPADFTYTVDGQTLTLLPGATMNVGRDDEVGLMNVGRDDEVGLNDAKADGQKGSVGKGEQKKTLFRDGDFLAVTDADGGMLIYGKVADEAAQPSVTGAYTGTVAANPAFPAKFEMKDNMLVADFNKGQGGFKGVYAKGGYFVGVTNGSLSSGLAAVRVAADGSLDGIFLPLPFTSMNSNFDFKPGQ
jgi:hypothetical protein